MLSFFANGGTSGTIELSPTLLLLIIVGAVLCGKFYVKKSQDLQAQKKYIEEYKYTIYQQDATWMGEKGTWRFTLTMWGLVGLILVSILSFFVFLGSLL